MEKQEILNLKREIAILKKDVEKLNKENFSQIKVFKQVIVLADMQTLPSGVTSSGAVCNVGGKLYIYNGSAWVVAGTQS